MLLNSSMDSHKSLLSFLELCAWCLSTTVYHEMYAIDCCCRGKRYGTPISIRKLCNYSNFDMWTHSWVIQWVFFSSNSLLCPVVCPISSYFFPSLFAVQEYYGNTDTLCLKHSERGWSVESWCICYI